MKLGRCRIDGDWRGAWQTLFCEARLALRSIGVEYGLRASGCAVLSADHDADPTVLLILAAKCECCTLFVE